MFTLPDCRTMLPEMHCSTTRSAWRIAARRSHGAGRREATTAHSAPCDGCRCSTCMHNRTREASTLQPYRLYHTGADVAPLHLSSLVATLLDIIQHPTTKIGVRVGLHGGHYGSTFPCHMASSRRRGASFCPRCCTTRVEPWNGRPTFPLPGGPCTPSLPTSPT